MAVLETIRNFFIPAFPAKQAVIVPAAPTTYDIRRLTEDHLPEVLRLNIRCFRNGDNYTKHTFAYLLNEPRTLSYRMVTPVDEIVGFAFVMVNENNAAHLTTIGVAPEHRRRQIAVKLLGHIEESLRKREVGTIMLEVRVGNTTAQDLYRRSGYTVVQRIGKYYNNGEDCFLMMKSLN
ncbi:MAG: ribosomal protein S18-alanine N-acetyltransferase [Pyrinomonadaceae bacterium]